MLGEPAEEVFQGALDAEVFVLRQGGPKNLPSGDLGELQVHRDGHAQSGRAGIAVGVEQLAQLEIGLPDVVVVAVDQPIGGIVVAVHQLLDGFLVAGAGLDGEEAGAVVLPRYGEEVVQLGGRFL